MTACTGQHAAHTHTLLLTTREFAASLVLITNLHKLSSVFTMRSAASHSLLECLWLLQLASPLWRHYTMLEITLLATQCTKARLAAVVRM